MKVLRLAFRHTLRNRRRSLITILAMAFSLAIMVAYIGLCDGLMRDMRVNAIMNEIGHVQVHAPGYMDTKSFYRQIDDPEALLDAYAAAGLHASARLYASGLCARGTSSAGVVIRGVDPVAEADVYLAYGRDLQAEEILKEAMRSNPERMAVRTKLLEVYAKRRDTKGFELLATQMYMLTKGQGDDWAKAQEMGLQIDPDNPMYQPGGEPVTLVQGRDSRLVEPLGASTMPQSILPSPSQFSSVLREPTETTAPAAARAQARPGEPPAILARRRLSSNSTPACSRTKAAASASGNA